MIVAFFLACIQQKKNPTLKPNKAEDVFFFLSFQERNWKTDRRTDRQTDRRRMARWVSLCKVYKPHGKVNFFRWVKLKNGLFCFCFSYNAFSLLTKLFLSGMSPFFWSHSTFWYSAWLLKDFFLCCWKNVFI